MGFHSINNKCIIILFISFPLVSFQNANWIQNQRNWISIRKIIAKIQKITLVRQIFYIDFEEIYCILGKLLSFFVSCFIQYFRFICLSIVLHTYIAFIGAFKQTYFKYFSIISAKHRQIVFHLIDYFNPFKLFFIFTGRKF